MDEECVRIRSNNQHSSNLKKELLSFIFKDLYCDTVLVCSDGKLRVNSIAPCILYPHLEENFRHFQDVKTLILPSQSREEIRQEILAAFAGVLENSERLPEDESAWERLPVDESVWDGSVEENTSDVESVEQQSAVSSRQKRPRKDVLSILSTDQNGGEMLDEVKEEEELDVSTQTRKNINSEGESVKPCRRTLKPGGDTGKHCRRSKGRSWIWEYFDRNELLKDSAFCRLCWKEIKTKKGCTTSMIRHLAAKHPSAVEGGQLPAEEEGKDSWVLRYSIMMLEDEARGYACNFCQKFIKSTAGSATGIVNHLEQIHKEIFRSACFHCKLHIQNTEDSTRCEVCECVYHSACREPLPGEDQQCEYCAKQERLKQQKTKYYINRLNNLSEISSVCPHCGKEFKNLSNHISTFHSGTKVKYQPAQCDICKKVFTQKIHLKEHIKSVHEQIKDYMCRFCPRQFYRKTNFQRHMKSMHMNLRREEEVDCSTCGKVFKCKNSLTKHRRKVHEGIVSTRKVFCADCGHCFTQTGSLYKHIRKVHGREPEIPVNRKNAVHDKVYVDTAVILNVHPELKPHLL